MRDINKINREGPNELVELRQRIAELKESEAQLRRTVGILKKSETEKQTLLDASIDMIRLVDNNMRILWANKTTIANLDITPNDIVGKTCHKVFTGRELPCQGCLTEKTIETGQVEHAVIHKTKVAGTDGESDWDCYVVPVKNVKAQRSNECQNTKANQDTFDIWFCHLALPLNIYHLGSNLDGNIVS